VVVIIIEVPGRPKKKKITEKLLSRGDKIPNTIKKGCRRCEKGASTGTSQGGNLPHFSREREQEKERESREKPYQCSP